MAKCYGDQAACMFECNACDGSATTLLGPNAECIPQVASVLDLKPAFAIMANDQRSGWVVPKCPANWMNVPHYTSTICAPPAVTTEPGTHWHTEATPSFNSNAVCPRAQDAIRSAAGDVNPKMLFWMPAIPISATTICASWNG